jgi:2-dehydro-3-deoxygluconokinase
MMQIDNNTLLVSFGEIMLRLDCPPEQRFYRNEYFKKIFGGAEANVSAVLSRLGLPVRYVTALPENDIAQSAIDSLRSCGVDTSHIYRTGERIGIYFTEHGNNIRSSKVIYDRKNSSFATLTPGVIDWEKALSGARYFLWSGISASLTQNAADVCKEAIDIARDKGLTIIADMNYRRTLWNYGKHPSEVMPGLLSRCDIITGDIDTIDVFFGIKEGQGTPEDKFRYCAGALKKILPAMKVLSMSFRGSDQFKQATYSGALMINDTHFFSPVYSLPQIIDRIGSGDAYLGGLLYGLIHNLSGQDTINFAVATGALKHSIEGDFSFFSKEEIELFIKNGAVNRVIR